MPLHVPSFDTRQPDTPELRAALVPTEAIDLAHPHVRETAEQIARGSRTARDAAIRIHRFVRDEIRFGFSSRFYAVRASDVLRERIGYCNPKGTLFVALLRVLGIPARLHLVDLTAAVLHGLIDPGTPFVDHAYAEVHLDGAWRRTDSYTVDASLFTAARARLRRERRRFGYGANHGGVLEWDGHGDSFVQFVTDDSGVPHTTTDRGVIEDLPSFYARAPGWNRLNAVSRLVFPVAARVANQRADALRREHPARS